jgi:hypothetical protein
VPKPRSRSKFFSKDTPIGLGALAENVSEIIPAGDSAFVMKTADESITSDATLSDDAELFFDVRAGERWDIHLIIQYLSTVTPVIRFKLSVPGASPTGTGAVLRPILAAVNKEELFLDALSNLDAFSAGGIGSTPSTDTLAVDWHMNVLVGDADGRIALQWCQATSNVNTTTVFAGSWINARKV